MASTTTIPITVDPEAAARIEALGLRPEFEQLLEHTRENVPELRRIEVTLEYKHDEVDDPTVVVTSHRLDPGVDYDPVDRAWGEWFVRQFSPDVCRHFVMLSCYEPADAR